MRTPYSSKRLPNKPLWGELWSSRKDGAREAERLTTINSSLLGGTTLGKSVK